MQIMQIFNFSNLEMRNGTIQCFLQHQRIIVYRDKSNIESCTSNFPTFKRANLKMTTIRAQFLGSRSFLQGENCSKSYHDFKMHRRLRAKFAGNVEPFLPCPSFVT